MANKLRDIFSSDDENYEATINFESPTEYLRFIDALEAMNIDGKPKLIEGVSFVDLQKRDYEYMYPMQYKTEVIDQVLVSPMAENISIPVQVEGTSLEMNFIRKLLPKRDLLETKPMAVVGLEINYDLDSQTISFKCNTHPSNAIDLQELILEYKKALVLIEDLFKKSKEREEVVQMESFFKNSIIRFIQIEKLSNILNIHVNPSVIETEDNEGYLFEKLYLLLVCKEKIRTNDKLNHISGAELNDESVGQPLLAIYMETWDVTLFGEKFQIYTVNCMFNAIISSVSDDSEKNKKVTFHDSDSKPMYRVYTGYCNKEDAEKEFQLLNSDIGANSKQYDDALPFNELLKKLKANMDF